MLLGASSVATIAVFYAQTAAAQATNTPPAASPAVLGDVIVTARRVSENQQRVPIAITNLSAAALEQRSIKAVNDIQFSVPNLQIKPSNTYASKPEFIIRGQKQTLFTDENVVTYVNGVPQSTRGLTLYDLESVQALKGPQGTLFGKNSNGGAMVFTTKQPIYTFEAGVDLEYGNYDRRTATAFVNIPIVDDKVALRLAGNIERRDGFYENVYPAGGDMANLHNQSVRATLRLDPVERLNSVTTFDALRRDEIPTPYITEAAPLHSTGFGALTALLTQQAVTQQSAFGGASPLLANGLLIRQGDPFVVSKPTEFGPTFASTRYSPIATNATRVKALGVANTTSYELSKQLTLRNTFGYRDEEAFDSQDSNGTAGLTLNLSPFLTALGVPGLPANFPGPFDFAAQNYVNRDKAVTEEFQVIGKYDRLDFILGSFYSHINHYYATNNSLIAGPVDIYRVGPRYGDERLNTNSYAIFGQGSYRLLDRLRLTAGLRYTWDDRDYRGSNFYANGDQSLFQTFAGAPQVCNELNGPGTNAIGVNTPDTCAILAQKMYRALTWTFSLDYQATPDTLLYVSNRRGYKAGGPNPTTVNRDFALFGPERLTDVEVGVKHQGQIGSMPYRINLDGFYGWYKDIQTQDVLSFCATDACTAVYTDLILFNVGAATIKGVELDATVKPLPELQIDVGYSYQVGRYSSGSVIPRPTFPGPIGPTNPIDFSVGFDLSGHDFPGVPKQTFTLAATYQLTFVPESFARPELNVNYFHRSKSPGLAALGVYPSEGFGLLNARLAFNDLFGSKVSLAFWGANLTNKTYRLTCADNLSSISSAACKWGDPRTYGMTISARFN